jgi:hypothetical protein
MAFDTFSERLKLVANASIALCRSNWGAKGLRKEAPIDQRIAWQPTFHLKPSRTLIVAVEVADVIFPEILKIAARDIERYNTPISVYQACSLDVFQNDTRLSRVNSLRQNGFGIITVDDSGMAVIQSHAEPLGQHIHQETFDEELRTLPLPLKVKFRAAYATYQANVGQGLQEAGQIVEALIHCIAAQAESAGVVPVGTSAKRTADVIDDLYPTGAFHNYRAALGGARSFARTYRNIASHPATTASQAAEKFRRCKTGFLEALRIATELRTVIRNLGYRVIVH